MLRWSSTYCWQFGRLWRCASTSRLRNCELAVDEAVKVAFDVSTLHGLMSWNLRFPALAVPCRAAALRQYLRAAPAAKPSVSPESERTMPQRSACSPGATCRSRRPRWRRLITVPTGHSMISAISRWRTPRHHTAPQRGGIHPADRQRLMDRFGH